MTASTMLTAVTAVGSIAGFLGLKELLGRWVTRRGEREESAEVDRREVSVVKAEGNLIVLKELLTETRNRVDGYREQIEELKTAHAQDMAQLKSENRSMERQMADLRAVLTDWQLGNRVPRGSVLMPVREVRRLRETQPGLLEQRWYPGELDAEHGAGMPLDGSSIHARITRLDPPPVA